MNSQITLKICFVALAALAASSMALAQTTSTLPASMAMTAEEASMTKTLQAAYPKNRIRWVKETPIKDLWEVTMATNVAYVVANAQAVKTTPVTEAAKMDLFRYWVFGATVFDMKEAKDLTTPAKERAQTIDVATLPLKQAITRVKGTGERTLYVFTDPDCPHCRRLEATLETIENVTIHTFLTPIVALHPKAREVAAAIWCAKKQAQALVDYMTKDITSMPTAACETPILANEQLMESMGIKGTPTVFFADGTRHTGAMNKTQLEKRLSTLQGDAR